VIGLNLGAAPLITPAPVPNCPAPDTGVGVTITPSALGSADVTVDISETSGSLALDASYSTGSVVTVDGGFSARLPAALL